MPSVQPQSDQTPAGVLSRVAEFSGLAERLSPVGKVRDLYRRVQRSPEGFRLEGLLAEMRVDLRFNDADRSRIPATGPVVVVANHPYGMLDGAVLTVLLTRVRPDVKVLTNFLLSDVPELQQHCIFVDPFQSDQSGESNRRALRQALAWLRQGGMLAMFPAGEVSHWQMPPAHIADSEWNETAARLIRKSGAAALPVYFCGHNSVGFQLLSMIHPKLRSAFLLQEFLQQEGKTVQVRVGSEISSDAVSAMPSDREATEYLRWRTYLLERRGAAEVSFTQAVRSKLQVKAHEQPLAPPEDRQAVAEELSRLPSDRCLLENGDFAVYLATAADIPHLL